MAHFSVSGDSIASHCIFVGIGFETCTCNNHYLAAFVLPGLAICFCGKMLCFLSWFFVKLKKYFVGFFTILNPSHF